MASQVINNQAKNRFEVHVSGHLAHLDYRLQNNLLTLIHTQVPSALEGQGLGGKLVKFALDHARRQDWSINPECSFVRSYLVRHPEYENLVQKAEER